MKKILIMIMSCQDNHFINEEEICKETYLSRLPDNIDYIIYRGGYDKMSYDEKTHILYVNELDDLNNTFKKTYTALKYVYKKFDFDFIFRTNTSTYINIPLLNYFCQKTDINKIAYGGEMAFMKFMDEGLYKYPYIRGNGLLINKYHINVILTIGKLLYVYDNIFADDYAIGGILNIVHNYPDFINYIKIFREAWYKSSLYPYSDHQVCNMNNENIEFNFLKTCMIIQIKNWYDRTTEYENFKIIDNVFKTNKDDDIENSYNINIKYMENPDVFLGEPNGFLKYSDIFKNTKG